MSMVEVAMAIKSLVVWVETVLDEFVHMRASAPEVADRARLSGVWSYPIRNGN